MPMFEYACPNCGHVFEKLVLARSAKTPECPKCGRRRGRADFLGIRHGQRKVRAPCVRPRAAADGSELRGQAAPDSKGTRVSPSRHALASIPLMTSLFGYVDRLNDNDV